MALERVAIGLVGSGWRAGAKLRMGRQHSYGNRAGPPDWRLVVAMVAAI